MRNTLGYAIPQGDPNKTTNQQPTNPTNTIQMMSLVAAEVSKSVATALQNASSATQTQTNRKLGKVYDDHEVAIIKGFCAVQEVEMLLQIWGLFQTTKNVETHCINLKAQMVAWSRAHNLPIEQSIFFSKTTIDDFVNL